MPNWTRNLLIVGSKEKMNEIMLAHCPIDSETNTREMDFNTIKKMPKEMNIEYGSKSTDGLTLYLASLNSECTFYGNKEEKLSDKEYIHLLERIENHRLIERKLSLTQERLKEIKERYDSKLDSVQRLGEKMVSNLKKYDAMNWYEWSLMNWGTKWNATNTVREGNELTFDTAWDPPLPVILLLSKMHPAIPMAFLYADEETGVGTGYLLLTDGKVDMEGSFPSFSVDAYKLAFRVWKNEDDYHFDSEKKTYVLNGSKDQE